MIPRREEPHEFPLLSAIPGNNGIMMGSPKFDRLTMLKRITDARKSVTGLSRLLGPKSDVVNGLRKRTMDDKLKMFGTEESTRDIGDLFGTFFLLTKISHLITFKNTGHIATMQQSLTFYDAILSHDHPAYLGILRLSLASAKAGTDVALVKLYIISLTFLTLNILTGSFISLVKVTSTTEQQRFFLTLQECFP